MRHPIRFGTLTAVLVAFGAAGPLAQPVSARQAPSGQPAQTTQNQAANTGASNSEQRARQPERIPLIAAADIVGRPLTDPQGRSAGQIDSMIIDTRNGVVEYVLIRGRGDFDLDGELIAVPWSVVGQPRARGAIQVNVSIDRLAKAPRINRATVERLITARGRANVYGFYGVEYPYYGGPNWYWPARRNYAPLAAGPAAASAPVTAAANDQTPMEVRGSRAQHVAAARARADAGTQSHQPSGRSSDQNGQQSAQSSNGLAIGAQGVVSTLKAIDTVSPGQLVSANVYAENGDQMGHIDQVLIDSRNGHVAYILLERGGFLGLNPTWFAMPVEAVSWTPTNSGNGYRLTVDRKLLGSIPAVPVNKEHLTTEVRRHDLAQLYRHFSVKPYWIRQDQANGEAKPASKSTTGEGSSKP